MPYVIPSRRDEKQIREDGIPKKGELNYLITTYIVEYLRLHGLSYDVINNVGAAFRKVTILPYFLPDGKWAGTADSKEWFGGENAFPGYQGRKESEIRLNGINTIGDLAFLIRNICVEYILAHNSNEDAFDDVQGALVCAYSEFYRRVAVPYENGKIYDNGDVYEEFAPSPFDTQVTP